VVWMSRYSRRTSWAFVVECLVIGLILGVGVYARARGLSQKPFWGDEAWVAEAAADRSYGNLFWQTDLPIPPLFAIVTKLVGSLVSPPELGFRLVPLTCGILVVPLSFWIVRLLRVPRTVALTAMALCAASPLLLQWSRELKQYECEAFLSSLVALLVVIHCRPCSRRAIWRIRAAMIPLLFVCPWLGYGTVFPATALLAGLAWTCYGRRGQREGITTALIGFVCLVMSTVLVLSLVAAAQGRHPGLIQFTSHWFIDPLSLRSWMRAGAYGVVSTALVLVPVDWTYAQDREEILSLLSVLAAGVWLCILVGLWAWPGRGRRLLLCWILGAWALLLLAAVVRRYPFGAARMMVFTAPPMMLAAAAGWIRICRACALVSGRSSIGMVAGLLLSCLLVAGLPLRANNCAYGDVPAVLTVLQKEHRTGEPVLVSLDAAPAARYYLKRMNGQSLSPLFIPPIEAGTCRLPGHDYAGDVAGALNVASSRCWVVMATRQCETKDQLIWAIARSRGYRWKTIMIAGRAGNYGMAQLACLER